jgi:hypothetical protein
MTLIQANNLFIYLTPKLYVTSLYPAGHIEEWEAVSNTAAVTQSATYP